MTTPTSKIRFGNVSFRSEQIKEKTDYRAENGRQRYSVTFKTGQKVDFPEQKGNDTFITTDSVQGKVSLFANNIKNADIYGNPQKSDLIALSGNSSGNSIILDNDKQRGNATAIGSAILPGTGTAFGVAVDTLQQARIKKDDSVTLYSGTKDNIVKMGKEDATYIVGAPTSQSIVKGEGVCEQDIHTNGIL